MRHDSVLTRPARTAQPRALVVVLRRLRAFPLPGYAGAALTAVLTGIVVNALTLQHQRHPAPFFAPHPPASVAAPAPLAPPPPAPAAAQAADDAPAVVLPPERPASLGSAQEPTPPRRSDAIGDILREDAPKESPRPVLAAQNALIKLGYQLRADGVANSATLTALREFERAHGLPLSTDLTPRLLRHLVTAAAGR
jgi:hypothetical protein